MSSDNKKFYVYKYLDKDGDLLYVGQTVNPTNRYNDHKRESNWFKLHTEYIVAELPDKTSMDVYELYLINKLSPLMNVANARDDMMCFDLPELTFEPWKFPVAKTKKPKAKIIVDHKARNAVCVDVMIQLLQQHEISVCGKYPLHFIIHDVAPTEAGILESNSIFKYADSTGSGGVQIFSSSTTDVLSGIADITINLSHTNHRVVDILDQLITCATQESVEK